MIGPSNVSEDARACCHCGVDGGAFKRTHDGKTELRPYGPGGAWVCYRCAFETPERTEQSEGAFYALLEGASAAGSGIAVIGETEGPRPFDPREADV
jgi:hypothetical protein